MDVKTTSAGETGRPPSYGGAPDGEIARIASLADGAPVALAILDGPEHRYSAVNDAYRALARGKGELVGRTLAEVWPEAAGDVVPILDRVFESGAPYQGEEAPFRVERGRGLETIWLSFSFQPLREGGRITALLVLANDVTEHVRARSSALELARGLEAERAWLARSNDLAEALWGARSPAEVARVVFEKGLSVFGADAGALALPAPDAPDVLEIVEQFGYPAELIESWRRFPTSLRAPAAEAYRTGVPVWVDGPAEALARFPEWAPAVVDGADRAWAALPLVVEGRPIGTLGLAYRGEFRADPAIRDRLRSVAHRCALALERSRLLASQLRLAADLQASEERFRVMADETPIAIWVTDVHGRVEFVNRAYCEFFGTSVEAVRDQGWQPLVHPEDAEGYVGAFQRALATRSPFRARARVRHADGSWRVIDSHGAPRLSGSGEYLGFAGSSPDVTERQAVEDALREADRRKSDFLAVLSHELRNPLAPIRTGLQLLDRAPPGSDAARRAREVLHRQTEHLARLVDDLLDVTRISHGKIDLRRARLDARDAARRACEDARPGFEARGVALACELPEAPAWVEADEARLAQMLGNLLSNALKFTPPGGHVGVAVEPREAVCELRVRDDGAGIAPGELERIFEPFAQAVGTRDRSHGGLGLGLSLVRDLAALHGGTVRALSDGPGYGAELVITLPLAAGPGAGAGAGATAAVAAEGGLAILVVEDNEDAGATLAELLELCGHSTARATTGRAALESAAARRPDVLICDIGLPDLDGHAVLRELRRRGGAELPFAIALSGYTQPEDVERAREAGFHAHLSKPPDLRALEALLEEARARRAR